MTIQIGQGPTSKRETASSIYLTDESYSLIEPVLKRCTPHYHPDTRWGVAEFKASVWRLAVVEFKALIARLNSGEFFQISDVAWVHTVDLDNDSEISAEIFLRQLNSPNERDKIVAFLTDLITWIDNSLQKEAILTVYGY